MCVLVIRDDFSISSVEYENKLNIQRTSVWRLAGRLMSHKKQTEWSISRFALGELDEKLPQSRPGFPWKNSAFAGVGRLKVTHGFPSYSTIILPPESIQ